MISAFLHFIRKIINPLQLQLQIQIQKDIYYSSSSSSSSDIPKSNSNLSLSLDNTNDNDKTVRMTEPDDEHDDEPEEHDDEPEEHDEPDEEENKTIYPGIENTDLPQRVQHNICNLIGLDKEELAYIAEMDCKNMFEVVKLLNRAVISLVDGISGL